MDLAKPTQLDASVNGLSFKYDGLGGTSQVEDLTKHSLLVVTVMDFHSSKLDLEVIDLTKPNPPAAVQYNCSPIIEVNDLPPDPYSTNYPNHRKPPNH